MTSVQKGSRILLTYCPGWDVAAHYSPAGGQEAGGDFYDVVPVSGGRIAAIVGDVMGRGVAAAASAHPDQSDQWPKRERAAHPSPG